MPRLETRQLAEAERGLQVHHVVLEARDDAGIMAVPRAGEPFPGIGVDAVESKHAHAVSHSAVVRNRHPSFASDDVLRDIEGEARHIAVAAGRDSIDHPSGGHDDVANAAAGALVLVTGVVGKKKIPALFSGSSDAGESRSVHSELAALARSTIARLEAQDRADRRIEERYENEPMTSAGRCP